MKWLHRHSLGFMCIISAQMGLLLPTLYGCNMVTSQATDFYVCPDQSGNRIAMANKGTLLWIVEVTPSPRVVNAQIKTDGEQFGKVALSTDGVLVACAATNHQDMWIEVRNVGNEFNTPIANIKTASPVKWLSSHSLLYIKGESFGKVGGPTGKYKFQGEHYEVIEFPSMAAKAISKAMATSLLEATVTDSGTKYFIDLAPKTDNYKTTIYSQSGVSPPKRLSAVEGASYSDLWLMSNKQELFVQRQTGGSGTSGIYKLDVKSGVESSVLDGSQLRRLLRDAQELAEKLAAKK